jgi:hypothetical protein
MSVSAQGGGRKVAVCVSIVSITGQQGASGARV